MLGRLWESKIEPAPNSDWEMVSCKIQLLSMKEALDFSRKERESLDAEVQTLRQRRQYLEKHVEELTIHCNELEAMTVTSLRLLDVQDQAGAYRAVQDIVANVIGSEEMVLFAFNEDGSTLHPAAWCGVDVARYQAVKVGEGVVGKVATTGLTCLGPDEQTGMTACIPFHVEGRITGVLAIFQMLPQKRQLVNIDHDVLELVAKRLGSYLI